LITIAGLTKNFGAFPALKGIDLHVKKGEVYGFLGQNGAGKSTTMNILAGLSRPTAGTCQVNGWDLAKVTHPGDLHIGYLPEEPSFYPWLTGRETLEYLGSRWPKGPVKDRVQEMLNWVGLSAAAHRRVGGYSRGMRQRLGMAAALFYDAELILLDEPSSALDPEGRSDVLSLILDLKARGKTVFLSTHILSDAERVCDRVGILAQGKMVLEKSLETLIAENVKSLYDVVAPGEVSPRSYWKGLKGSREFSGWRRRGQDFHLRGFPRPGREDPPGLFCPNQT
jgi:ABC-2 type transport system ATP-binding protein